VSHVYASPLLASVAGSHGYDTVDPSHFNRGLGSEEDFGTFWRALRDHAMGLMLDIVPNHMGADADENPWWREVLALGRRSRYAGWFDLDLDGPADDGRIVLPVLGAPLDEAIEAGDVYVEAGREPLEDGPVIRYQGRTFPLAPGTARRIDPSTAIREPAALAALLARQHYRLAYRGQGNAEVNYRRFFDVSQLVAVRQEDRAVFDAMHALILRTIARGREEGVPVALRVDHVDGLADPDEYLARLRVAVGPDTYVVVEKILARGEDLIASWPVAGESGYAFLDAVDGLFIDPRGVRGLRDVAVRGGERRLASFDRLARAGKREVLDTLFVAERDRLTRLARLVAARDGSAHGISGSDLQRAIVELTVALPVYRTYLRRGVDARARDARLIARAARDAAVATSSPAVRAAIRFLRDTLLSAGSPGVGLEPDPAANELIRRWQQLTGAVAAKGVEDTALYRDPSIPSRCEVGSNPGAPVTTVEAFHLAMRLRRRRWPVAMSTTSTHDTKRSEDARARLHVLSEIADEWLDRVERWRFWNARHRTAVGGRQAPALGDELAVYHALFALWPAGGWSGVDAAVIERIQRHALKSAREAKIHTDWLAPNDPYERSLRAFVVAVTRSHRSRFARDVAPFARFLAFHGALNALAEVVLKATAPGIPDVYQGSELWDPRLVDPDNRAVVDLAARADLLAALDAAAPAGRGSSAASLEHWEDGEVKLLVLSRALRFRGSLPDLFVRGRYVPLRVRGSKAEHVVAFARRFRADWAVVVVPRLTARLMGRRAGSDPGWPPERGTWGSTRVILPPRAPRRWRDALTFGIVTGRGRDGETTLLLADVLDGLPVSILAPAFEPSP
jgi:(1->4)-alpha-D-glucan 1-alpha-D-glucosylmutase